MLPALNFTCTVSNIWWASDTLEICHEHEQIQTPYHSFHELSYLTTGIIKLTEHFSYRGCILLRDGLTSDRR